VFKLREGMQCLVAPSASGNRTSHWASLRDVWLAKDRDLLFEEIKAGRMFKFCLRVTAARCGGDELIGI